MCVLLNEINESLEYICMSVAEIEISNALLVPHNVMPVKLMNNVCTGAFFSDFFLTHSKQCAHLLSRVRLRVLI